MLFWNLIKMDIFPGMRTRMALCRHHYSYKDVRLAPSQMTAEACVASTDWREIMALNYHRFRPTIYVDAIPQLKEMKDVNLLNKGNKDSINKFLSAIGRNCNEYENKFEDWEDLLNIDLNRAVNEKNIDLKKARYIVSSVNRYK